MKYLRLGLALASLWCASGMGLESATAAESSTESAVMKEMIAAYYYARTDAKSEIRMRIVNRQGQTRERRLILLRLDKTDGGGQSYYIYFHIRAAMMTGGSIFRR